MHISRYSAIACLLCYSAILKLDFQKYVNFEKFSNLLQQLTSIQYIPGDMSCWIELYLEIINLLLNIIKFQQTSNWNSFFQGICNFLLFCFAMNQQNYAYNLSYYFTSILNL